MRTRVDRPEDLSTEDVDELYRFFCGSFEAERVGLELDLREKDRVMRVWGDSGLAAFSTLLLFRPSPRYRVFYSGDTLTRGEARLGHHLPSLWARYVFQEVAPEKGVEDYWLLLCSGFRTYRILPTFFQRFYPGPEGSSELQGLRDDWASARFGEAYSKGIVRPRFATVLKDPEPPARLVGDPHVRFFREANPGYARGEELACLVSLDPNYLKPAGRRLAFSKTTVS